MDSQRNVCATDQRLAEPQPVPEDLNAKLARLKARFTDWHFWRAEHGTGDLMATRKAHITDALVYKGLARSLPIGCSHNSDLEQQLAEQTAKAIEIGLYAKEALH